MVSVYTHIKPFQKRAIDFFRSCLGEIGKEGQIRSVLDELFRKQAFFKELLASFGPALTDEQRVYIEGLAADVETSLDTVLIEQAMLQSILLALNPCLACKGHGEFYTHTGQSEGYYSKCETCGGDGVAKSAEEVMT
ncbi:hypothetical protein LCGC14_1871010 [marine sediment metagenome]|uniref:Uncharacterized protein n=1 Tax=marine sediment metagenome TaxID=412755 RepID=A0A0F9GT48_9ZZZZ